MADWQTDTESSPAAGAGGTAIVFVDSTTKKLSTVDDGGNVVGGSLSRNVCTGSQTLGTADTYVTNSGIVVPTVGMQAGMVFRWVLTGRKTAAGAAAAVYTIRCGTLQTTGDTSVLAFTSGAIQTAAIDIGILVVTLLIRTFGATGSVAGAFGWMKNLATATGFGDVAQDNSGTFDTTGRAGQFVGLSINGGAASAWTFTTVHGQLIC
jgi:hypothetical protein